MDDLISKQDKRAVVNLIDNINAISFYEANEHSKECYYDIRNAILAMPEQESKWIPVSDRLPEENTYVLITAEWEDGSTDVGIDRLVDGKWILSLLDEGDKATAWMPLPEPYEPQESEEISREEIAALLARGSEDK